MHDSPDTRTRQDTAGVPAGAFGLRRPLAAASALVVVSGLIAWLAPAAAVASVRTAAHRPARAEGPAAELPGGGATPGLPPGVRFVPPSQVHHSPFALGHRLGSGLRATQVPLADRPGRPGRRLLAAASARVAGGRGRALATASPPPTDVQIASVSCWSTTGCMAVGYANDYDEDHGYAMTWNGAAWRPVAVPQYTLGGILDAQQLDGVSCTSADFCVAVGEAQAASYHLLTLALTWNGHAWTLAMAPLASDDGGYLDAVSCWSTTLCEAVGRAGSEPMAETFTGSDWTIETTPTVLGSNSYLSGVSCSSASYCLAAGVADDDTALLFARVGSTWVAVTSANPSSEDYLAAVSCPTTSSCTAVGYQQEGAITSGLIEQFAISSGTTTLTTVSSGRNPDFSFTELYGVACSAAATCVAVGEGSNTGNDEELPYAESLSGSKWTPLGSQAPGSFPFDWFSSVSCRSATACVAVGTQDAASTTYTDLALGEVLSAHGFAAKAIPPVDEPQGWVDEISCVDATSCVAAGGYDTGSSDAPLVDLWDGKHWRLVATPNAGVDGAFLYGDACTSTTFCLLVGGTVGIDNYDLPFAVTYNGSSLVVRSVPTVGLYDDGAVFYAAACTGPSSCLAIGATDYEESPFSATWNGTTFHAMGMAQPGGDGGQAESVSCATATECFAPLQFSGEDGDESAVEKWNGSTWSLVAPALVVAGTDNVEADGVDCISAKRCVMVGEADRGVGWQPMSAIFNGKTWSTQLVASPTGAENAYLGGVACPTATTCVAVGAGETVSGYDDNPTAAVLNGSTWTESKFIGSIYGELYAASCPTASLCFGSGVSYPFGAGDSSLLYQDHKGTWSLLPS